MLDTKKFMNQLIIDAQMQGFKPLDISFNEMFALFDFKKFEETLKFLRTDEFGLVLYKLALCDAVFLAGTVDYSTKDGKTFSKFVIEYCGGSNLLLREEFGGYESFDGVATPKVKNLEDNYYLLGDMVYCHQPKMFLLDWILPYFYGLDCMPFCGSFLTTEHSIPMKFVETCVNARLAPTEDYDIMLTEYSDKIEDILVSRDVEDDDDDWNDDKYFGRDEFSDWGDWEDEGEE